MDIRVKKDFKMKYEEYFSDIIGIGDDVIIKYSEKELDKDTHLHLYNNQTGTIIGKEGEKFIVKFDNPSKDDNGNLINSSEFDKKNLIQRGEEREEKIKMDQ